MSGVRVVIVGAGLMGRCHATAARHAGATIEAIVDSDRVRAEQLSGRVGATRALTELPAALAGGSIDVVHICTPLDTHVDLARLALEAGCHVLMEKPFAPDLESAEALFAIADRRQRLICPVHQFLFQDGALRTERLLPDLGALRHLEWEVASTGAERGRSTFDEVVLEILPHGFAFAARWLGTAVGEAEWSVTSAIAGECAVSAVVGGARISLRISLRGRPPSNRLRVVAERGTIELDLFNGYAVLDRSAATRPMKLFRPVRQAVATAAAATLAVAGRVVRREFAYPGLRKLVARFHAATRGQRATPIPTSETLAVTAAWSHARRAISGRSVVAGSPRPVLAS